METEVSHKIKAIRSLMEENGIEAYIVPHNDAHDSEYTMASDERLSYISGFTGSAGIALITQEVAYMWTDSRYFLQAVKELETGWEMKKLQKGEQLWFEFASQNLKGKKLGYNPTLFNAQICETRSKVLESNGVHFVQIDNDLVDLLWKFEEEQAKEIIIHEDQWIEDSIYVKLSSAFDRVKDQNVSLMFTSKLDQIAWVLNLRGFDVPYNPLFKSFLLVEQNAGKQISGKLYVDELKVNAKVREYLKAFQIEVFPYLQIYTDLPCVQAKVLVTKQEVNSKLFAKIPKQHLVLIELHPIEIMKAVKGVREQKGFRDCHIRDGAAVIRFLAWLEHQLIHQKRTDLDEFTVTKPLEDFRKQAKFNMGLSFPTISCSGPNAAIIHYHPHEGKSALLKPDDIYLLDSGGQYLDGTTDITRTYLFGQPTQEMKNAYTRVLLGNLDVERIKFPANSSINGGDIDVLARRWLWEDGLDYGHGTGHGVGYFLNVHEGPHGISKYRTQPFVPGVVVSDEPGYYKEGAFGIRIENLILCVDLGNSFYGFENITMCPYDLNLVDKSLLSNKDCQFINNYHQKVRQLTLPELQAQNDELAIQWLMKRTEPFQL